MTFRPQYRLSIAVAAALLLACVLVPTAAFADSLSWTQTYYGPSDIPNSNPELDDIAVAARFNGIAFLDATHGWAVGTWTDGPTQYSAAEHGLAAYTNDGGSTWTTYTPPAAELMAVAMPAPDKVFATSAAGKIVHWNGLGWSLITVTGWPTSGSRALRGIAFTDSQHGWAVGDLGGVAKTIDGGATWTTVSAPTSGKPTLYAVDAVDSSKLIAVGAEGAIRSITASGVSVVSGPSTGVLRGVSFADALHGWAVGDAATMLKTADGGATWTLRVAPIPPGYTASALSITSVSFADESSGVAVGAYQRTWRTFDGGSTWSYGSVPGGAGDSELRGAGFVPGDPGHPVAVGGAYKGQLTQSTDKARIYRGTWTGRVTPPPAAPVAVAVANGGVPGPRATVSWTDASSVEQGFAVERSQGSADGPWTGVATTTANAVSWTDAAVDWGSTWYYRVRSFNAAGASDWVQSDGIKLDTSAPVTTSDERPVYVSSASLRLAPTDSQSGVASTEWILDGTPGTGTLVETSALGAHTLQFRSTDAAGNVEQWKSVSFYVSDSTVADAIKPVTTLGGTTYPYYTVPATISLVATDQGGSGLFGTYARVNGGSAVATTSVSMTSTGTYLVEYWSVDYAGNVEATRSLTFTVLVRPSSTGQPSRPVTPPAVTRSKSFTTYGYVKRYSRTYSLKLYFYRYESGKWVYKASDSTAQYRVSVPDADFNKYRASTSLTKAGKWRVRARHVVGSKTVYSAYQYFTVN